MPSNRLFIGNVKIKNPVFSAPMAGVSDRVFRTLAKENDCALTFTEMVSATAIIYNNLKTYDLFDISGDEKPVAVQIFGADPNIMAKAAKIVLEQKPQIIDINMGCPAPKVVKNNEGSALMKTPKLIGEIVKSVCDAVDVPVMVKIRAGWSKEHINAVEIAKIIEQSGASAITVHGRTRCQFYSGQADWDIIKKVKESVSIPVVGNGDIHSPLDAKRMLEETGCDYIMIGRSAMGNPWIFKRTAHYLKTGVLLKEPSPAERIQMAIRHYQMMLKDKGEFLTVRQMRKHLAWYFKGMKHAARMRDEINKINSSQLVIKKLEDYLSEFL